MLRLILDSVPSLKAPGLIWQAVFGGDHEKFSRDWLVPLTQRPRSHACDRCGGLHKIIFHSAEDIVSVPPPDSHCEREILTLEEAGLCEFNEWKFAEQLCSAVAIELNIATHGKSGLLRIGWIGGPLRQYPVFLLLRNPRNATAIARNLLLEEESPFVFFANTDLPHLYPLFKKQKCALFPLTRIAGLSASGLSAGLTGPELFSGFLRGVEGTVYMPVPEVQPLDDYARISFPDGTTIYLSRAPVRRSIVRFIHQWVQQSGNPAFDIEVIRDAHNRRHPDKAWESPRFREDLFKRNEEDFDRLFEVLDNAGGRFRIKF